MSPQLSRQFESRQPSAVRQSSIAFMKRKDKVTAVNTSIGNVSLPIHPAIQKRMFSLNSVESPFKDGVVKYSPTVGEEETQKAFFNIIVSSGFQTDGLYCQVTDGGSQAMELVILGVCGPAGTQEQPLLLIDAAYSNYLSIAERVGRPTVSISRKLDDEGVFELPDISEIEKVIQQHKPNALLIIPYDNPTGQFMPQHTIEKLAQLCVKYNLWLVSDEAYRELFYTGDQVSSVWGVTEASVPGITGRRISIESASKVWNGCGLRTGALITDNALFHQQGVAENTASLCANVLGQYVFGALAHESHEDLQKWYAQQREYYKKMMFSFLTEMKKKLPDLIISKPDAALYSVIDVRHLVPADFNAKDFVMYCAEKGKVNINGVETTLLVAPMAGFYSVEKGQPNPGKTQMRIAYVESPEVMAQVPMLFAELLKQYLAV